MAKKTTARKKATKKVAKKATKKVAKKATKKVAKKAAKKTTRKKKWDWKEGLTGKSKKRKSAFDTMDEVEAAHIRSVLTAYGHDIQQTALALGIARSTVYRKMKRYKIQ